VTQPVSGDALTLPRGLGVTPKAFASCVSNLHHLFHSSVNLISRFITCTRLVRAARTPWITSLSDRTIP
jgi:hypothetical protein